MGLEVLGRGFLFAQGSLHMKVESVKQRVFRDIPFEGVLGKSFHVCASLLIHARWGTRSS